jgi:hypothetical protein
VEADRSISRLGITFRLPVLRQSFTSVSTVIVVVTVPFALAPRLLLPNRHPVNPLLLVYAKSTVPAYAFIEVTVTVESALFPEATVTLVAASLNEGGLEGMVTLPEVEVAIVALPM